MRAYTSSLLERRRIRAVHLYERGWRVTQIAATLSVTPAAVSQWLTAFRANGAEALKARPKTGAPKRVSDRHALMITALLSAPPSASGINADRWDRDLVRRAIKRVFGVSYSLQHCGRLLKAAKVSTSKVLTANSAELAELLHKADIARIRTQISKRHGKRTRRY